MEITFKRNKKYKYICAVCGTEFNWHDDAWRFGKMEYKTVQHKENELKFCSTFCKDKFLNEDKN